MAAVQAQRNANAAVEVGLPARNNQISYNTTQPQKDVEHTHLVSELRTARAGLGEICAALEEHFPHTE